MKPRCMRARDTRRTWNSGGLPLLTSVLYVRRSVDNYNMRLGRAKA